MSIVVDDAPATVPADEPAPDRHEYACEVCGAELTYGGRGRKPRFCAEHKKSASSGSRRAAGKGNDALARQAADTLSAYHGLVAAALTMAPGIWRMPSAAAELIDRDESFNEAACKALLADPKLARMILRGGGVSGALGLIIAYAMLLSAVVPAGMADFQAGRAQRRSVDAGAEVV